MKKKSTIFVLVVIAQIFISETCPTRLVCIVWMHCILFPPILLTCLLFCYYSTLHFHSVVISWSNIFWHFACCQVFYYLPGCKFHIFPIDLLTQGSSGCVATQYYSSICIYKIWLCFYKGGLLCIY